MNVLALFKKVKAFVFDIDGVLTNADVLLLPDIYPEGTLIMARTMNTKDGFAIQRALKQGYPVAIISGGKKSGAEQRLEYLGVQYIFMDIRNKLECLDDFLQSQHLQRNDVLYMGDDIPDYEVLKAAGLKACPADAIAEIKELADYISPYKGGKGCVRDVIEKAMKLQGNWALNADTRAI